MFDWELHRVFPDGTIGEDAFRVPGGNVFIVTDVSWTHEDAAGDAAAGQLRTLALCVGNLSGDMPMAVFLSPIVLNSSGKGGASKAMTTGFVVSSQGVLCPIVMPPLILSSGHTDVIVRGHLAPDK